MELWTTIKEIAFRKQFEQREQVRKAELLAIEKWLTQAHAVTPDEFAQLIHDNRKEFIDLLESCVVTNLNQGK